MKVQELLFHLKNLQLAVRRLVQDRLGNRSGSNPAAPARHSPGDVLYQIDVDCDEVLHTELARIGNRIPILVVAEGISEAEPVPFPKTLDPRDAEFTLVLDPIDGTRMIMFDKRSAWSLAAVARNRPDGPTLRDVEAAVMTEIPPSKQSIVDCVWAVKGMGARGERIDLRTGVRRSWKPNPSQSGALSHGFAQFTKFFLGDKKTLALAEEELFRTLGACPPGESPRLFDDQYLSTGGQLYEILAGRDLFQADVRASLRRTSVSTGPSLACHPYDICTELIAREAGAVITDIRGEPIDCPLDVSTEVDWIGFANRELRDRMQPVLDRIFREAGWI